MGQVDENKLIAERRRKLNELRESGDGIAYPNDVHPANVAVELHKQYAEDDSEALANNSDRVSVAGRMMAKRVMGRRSFVVLEDATGRIQLYIDRDVLPDGVYAAFKTWDVGDILAAEGGMYRTNTGELSIQTDQLRLVTKSLRPLPEKFHGLSDQETRYRQRYVDLIMNEESRDVFRARSAVVAFTRAHLEKQSFLEVETPMMQPIPGGAVARPFMTHHNALDMQLYLRIAPELYLKRLIVGGLAKVYEINRSFRNEGISTQHNPEFTMLELYWAYADYNDIMNLTEKLIRGAARHLHGTGRINYQDMELDLDSDFQRISMEDSVIQFNPDLDRARLREVDYLRAQLSERQVRFEDSYGAGKLLTELFEKTVEEKLIQPTFIVAYPTEVSPLSRANDADPFISDRFELFMAGREIANGFSELNDPEDQADRFKSQATLKADGDDEAMFYDEDYIRALEYGMPPAGGLGIGMDRLVMLLTNSASIRDVLLFPLLRPETG